MGLRVEAQRLSKAPARKLSHKWLLQPGGRGGGHKLARLPNPLAAVPTPERCPAPAQDPQAVALSPGNELAEAS